MPSLFTCPKNYVEEAGGRECEESWVEDRGSCRSNGMEGRCESNLNGTEGGNEEETELKLDDDDGWGTF